MANLIRRTAYKLWVSNIVNSEQAVDAGRFIGLHVNIDNKSVNVSRVNVIANVIDKFVSGKGNFASLTLDDSSGTVRLKVFNPKLVEEFNIGDTILVVGQLRLYNNEVYIAPEIIKHVEPLWLLARKLELEKLFGLKLAMENTENEMQTQQAQQTQQLQQTQTQQTKSSTQTIPLIQSKTDNAMGMTQTQEVQLQQPQQSVNLNAQQEQDTQTVGNTDTNVNTISNHNENKGDGKTINVKEEIVTMIKQNGEIEMDKLILSMSYDVDTIKKIIDELIDEAVVYEPRPGVIKIL